MIGESRTFGLVLEAFRVDEIWYLIGKRFSWIGPSHHDNLGTLFKKVVVEVMRLRRAP